MGAERGASTVRRGLMYASLALALSLGTLAALAEDADASHFRGGALNVKLTGNANEVEVSGWMAFKESYPWTGIGSTAPQVGQVMKLDVGPMLYGDNTQSVDDIHLRVVSIDTQADWFYGEIVDSNGKPFVHAFPSATSGGNAWALGTVDCCRLGGADGHMNNGGTGSGLQTPPNGDGYLFALIAYVDFTKATSDGPDAQVEPIVSCQKNAGCGIVPAIIDKAGDTLDFSFSTSQQASYDNRFRQPGHDPAHGTTPMTISNVNGHLQWQTTGAKLHNGGPTYYSVQLRAEDAGISVPMDFFIELVDPYTDPPYWTNASPCGQTLLYSATQSKTFAVQAESNFANRKITVSHLSLPPGATTTLPAAGNPARATFTWTPTLDDIGTHQVVFRAIDELDQRAPYCQVQIDVTIPPPEAVDDAYTLKEDSAGANYAILLNDNDPAGGKAFQITQLAGAQLGTATIINNGQAMRYVPNADAFGTDCVVYTIETTDKRTDTANACFTIKGVNDAPSYTVATNTLAVLEDSGLNELVWLTNVQAGPGETQTIDWQLTATQNHLVQSLQMLPDGKLRVRPATDAHGQLTVSVTPKDDGGTADGGQDTGPKTTLTLTITPVNDAPSFTPGGHFIALEEGDGPVTAPWATAILPGPQNEATQQTRWQVTPADPAFFSQAPAIGADGSIAFELATDAGGESTADVVLIDDGGTANGGVDTSEVHTLRFKVQPSNDPPEFDAVDAITVLEDAGTTSVRIATNIGPGGGSDEANQQLAWSHVISHPDLFTGAMTLSPDGWLTFTPAPDAFGDATLTVELKDDGGTENGGQDTSDAVAIPFTILPVNDAPSFTAGGDVEVTEGLQPKERRFPGWAKDISVGPANEADQGIGLSFAGDESAFTQLPRVTAAGTLVLTTAPGFYGTTNFTICPQDTGGTANGGVDLGACAEVTLEAFSINDPPTFQPGEDIEIDEDSGAYSETWATQISPGPEDEAWQKVWFDVVTEDPSLFSQLPYIDSEGVLHFTPRTQAFGATTLLVVARDDGGVKEGGKDRTPMLELNVVIHPFNDPPQAVQDTYTLEEESTIRMAPDEGVLRNDADADGDLLTASLLRAPLHGKLTFEPDGSFEYTPEDNFYGQDLFEYKIRDPAGAEASARVLLTVINVNDAPIGQTDYYRIAPDQTNTFTPSQGILGNDIDYDAEPLRAELMQPPVHGKLELRGDGSFVYTPQTGFRGTDFFVYRTIDGNGGSSLGSNVHLRVEENRPPVANFETRDNVLIAGREIAFLDRSVDADGQGISPHDGNAREGQDLASWVWEFGDGDGAMEQNPTHVYGEPGKYTVTLQVTDTDGTPAIVSKEILVRDRALVDPMATGAPVVFVESRITVLEGLAIPLHATVEPAGARFEWRQTGGPEVLLVGKSDAQPAANAPLLGPGEEELKLKFEVVAAGNGTYSAPQVVTVTVIPNPELGRIDAGPDRDVIEGAPIVLRAHPRAFPYRPNVTWIQTDGPAVGIGTVHGEIVRLQLPAGSSGATFTFRAIADDGTVRVYDDVTLRVITPLAPEAIRMREIEPRMVRFTGVEAVEHAWDFGDGTTSTLGSPKHTYAEPGTYTLTYEATDPQGRRLVYENTIEVQGEPAFAEPEVTPDAVVEARAGTPVGLIVGIIAGGVLLLGGAGYAVYRLRK